MNEGRVPPVLSLGRLMPLKVRGLHFEPYLLREVPTISDNAGPPEHWLLLVHSRVEREGLMYVQKHVVQQTAVWV